MTNLSASLGAIANLSAFAVKSGIPLRTLQRIKAKGDDYPVSPVTRVAIAEALRRHKPKTKDQL